MRIFCIFYLIIFVLSLGLFAQIPQTMSYQGLLTNDQGQTVNDGSYQMTFKIYDQETNGTLLWEETQSTDVSSGVFNVVLGESNPLTMNFDEIYWLSITIASGDELEPRIELTASPYSLNSQQVLGTNIIPADGNVGIGIVNPVSKLEVDGSWSLGITGAIPSGAEGRIYAPNGIYSEAGGTDWAHYFNTFGAGDIARFATGNLGEPLETKVVIKNNGNLGIGTGDPQEKLEVNGMIYSTLDGFRFPDGTVQTTAASGSGGEGDITSVNAGDGLTGGATAGDATLNVGAGTGISISADAVGLNTTYTDGRYVNEGQSNSINTTMITPSLLSSLDGVINDGGNVDLVAGSNVTITPSEAANTITISASGGGTADNLGNHTATQNINLNGNYLSGDGDSEGLFINTIGRVGIGISSPATHIHVHGSPVESRGQLSISAPPDEDTFLSFYEGANFKGYLWYDDSDDDLRLQNYNETNGGDLSLNPYGGHVGIGTTEPGNRKLNVVGGSETAIEASSTGGNAIYATSSAYSAINAYANCGGGDAAGYFIAEEYGTYGIYARSYDYDALYASSSAGRAGHFAGDVEITGTLSKGGGSFKIDHPLDPTNKNLYHSFVESPDMKNIYDGNVVTDGDGNATVELPQWFEALNKDFRYQLTVMGEFSQAIISEEINNNQFSIKTDRPNIKVSWQITGIRQDAFANAHRIPVEEMKKADEQGKYLYPEAFGMPQTMGVEYDEEFEQKRIRMEEKRQVEQERRRAEELRQ